MNRLRLLKQRAASHGLFVIRSGKHFDVVDSCGPFGLSLSRRAAINFAVSLSNKQYKVKIYIMDSSGKWHRGNCKYVAYNPSEGKPCKCSFLVLN